MIKKLTIKNFAIIDSMEVDFSLGFNVVTGETGAGKSLIVNAIDILLGGHLDVEMLRDSSSPLLISAIFDRDNNDVKIARSYNNKKSTYYIDDKKTSISDLLDKASSFIQFQKQHDSNKLLKSSKHIELLDNYAIESSDLLEIQKLYLKYVQSDKEYKDAINSESEYKNKLELYRYQLEELNAIELNEVEQISINNKYKVCINAKNILDIIDSYSKNNEMSDISPLKSIQKFSKSLSVYSNIDKDILESVSRLNGIIAELEDINSDMYGIQQKFYFNPEDLELLEDKVEKYEQVKRKYGGTIKSAISYKDKIESELEHMPSFKGKIKKLLKNLDRSRLAYYKKAKEISALRHIAAKNMSKRINKYLTNMDMPNAEIKIELKKMDAISDNGIDICEFYAITNKGERFKKIKKIASGGEISRVMLAINLANQKMLNVDTLIFDEVDTGISGLTASNVGSLLEELSHSRQLIIITHLPQIASKSKHHVYIDKIVKENRVISSCKILNKDEHKNEIARMLSGKTITDHSLNQASEMIANG